MDTEYELHPKAKALLASRRDDTPLRDLPLEEARERMRSSLVQEPIRRVERVLDVQVDGRLWMRTYHPEPARELPVLLFFHGGGWIFNDLDTHDALCRRLAIEAHCVVASVDYRLSPESKYPDALNDAVAAYEWTRAHGDALGADADRICVGGDSAGGAIAIALAKTLRDRGDKDVAGQLLLYPVLDYHDPGTPSYIERGSGLGVDRAFMEWIWSAYLPDEWSRTDPYIFPLQGDLAGLPPTMLCIAEFDLLRDEAYAFAAKLRSASVPVEFINAVDQMHGFANHADNIDSAGEVVDRTAVWLKGLFAAS